MHQALHICFWEPEKRLFQIVMTTTATGTSRESRLFYLGLLIRIEFLIDTGAELVSVLQHLDNNRYSFYKLHVVYGIKIDSYSRKSLTINFGIRRNFSWIFIQANVKILILETDFLAHFNLTVNMATKTLIDNKINIKIKGTISKYRN